MARRSHLEKRSRKYPTVQNVADHTTPHVFDILAEVQRLNEAGQHQPAQELVTKLQARVAAVLHDEVKRLAQQSTTEKAHT
jgi:hypothetical protein